MHLQLGDLEGAQLCFDAASAAAAVSTAAAAVDDAVDGPDAALRCKVDHGLLLFARKDYAGAKKQFEAVLAAGPGHSFRDWFLIVYHCTRTNPPHSPPWPGHSFPDSLLIVYQCTRTHSPHPPPWRGHSFPDSAGTQAALSLKPLKSSLEGSEVELKRKRM